MTDSQTKELQRGGQEGNQNAVSHGIYRARTGLPASDRKRLARYERELLLLLPWVQETDATTVRSFCSLLLLRDKIMAAIGEAGVLNRKGEPRRLVGELRQTLQALLAYSKELGLTPASRAALGLTTARGRALDLAAAMSDEDDDDE
jgi:phage terminase small subunit